MEYLFRMSLLFKKSFRIAGLAVLACLGTGILVEMVHSALQSAPDKSDFAQDYLMAKAFAAGENPYLPVNVLGDQFGIATQFTHPSPHPPSFVILCVPLALLSFQDAAFVYLLVGLICLFISVRLLWEVKLIAWLLLFVSLIAWPPVWSGLYLGQSVFIQLLLLLLMWQAMRTDRSVVAGLLLGLVISVKLLMWPLVLFLLVKRKFKVALSALTLFLVLNIAPSVVIGVGPITNYYLRVGREVASIYRNHAGNFSAWTIGPRLFVGTKTFNPPLMETVPLTYAPSLASVVSVTCVLVILSYAFFVALRAKSVDTSLAVLICVAVLVSPVAWTHYVALVLPSLALKLPASGWLNRASIFLCIVAPIISQLVFPLLESPIPFVVGLLAICPLFAVLSMIVALHRADSGRTTNLKLGQRQQAHV